MTTSNTGIGPLREPSPFNLEPGINNVTITYKGVNTTITVFVETPEMRESESNEGDSNTKTEDSKTQPVVDTTTNQSQRELLDTASNINKGTVTAADIKKASELGATTVTFGASVKRVSKNAFKGTKITTIVVKTKKLKKGSVKGSLKGSKVKTVKVQVGSKKVNKKYVKKYKKFFTKKNAGKKAKVK